MNNFEQRPEQPRSSSLSEVPPIIKSRGQFFKTRDEISLFVEQPLLEACQVLWDRNVRTFETSANQNNIGTGVASITIDFGSLSEENKNTTRELTETIYYDGDTEVATIRIPVSENSTVEEISKIATEIASTFKKQPATWIHKYTLDDLKQFHDILPDETGFDDPSVWQEDGFYYDPQAKLFYMSEEHYRKANEEIDTE